MAQPQKFKAPEFELEAKRQVEIPFEGVIAAGAFTSVVAGPMSYPFKVILAKMIFTDDANNLVRHGWYVGRNRSISATGPPEGENIFGKGVSPGIFTGRGVIRKAYSNVAYEDFGLYIKFYTNNTLAAAYRFNGSILIEEL